MKGKASEANWVIKSELNLNGKTIKVTDVGNELKLNVSSAEIYPSFANALFNEFSFAKPVLSAMKDEETGGFWATISGKATRAFNGTTTQDSVGNASVRITNGTAGWELTTIIQLSDTSQNSFSSLSNVSDLGELENFAKVPSIATLAFKPFDTEHTSNTTALQAGTTIFLKYNVSIVKKHIAALKNWDFSQSELVFRAHFSESGSWLLMAELGNFKIGKAIMVNVSATLQSKDPQVQIESYAEIKKFQTTLILSGHMGVYMRDSKQQQQAPKKLACRCPRNRIHFMSVHSI